MTLTVGTAYCRGDITGNGVVDQADVDLALRLAAGERAATTDEMKAGDLNGNGRIDPDDAHLILRMANGLNVNP